MLLKGFHKVFFEFLFAPIFKLTNKVVHSQSLKLKAFRSTTLVHPAMPSESKTVIEVAFPLDQLQWLREQAKTYSMPDEGKAVRCCVNFAAQTGSAPPGVCALDAASGETLAVAVAAVGSARHVAAIESIIEWVSVTGSQSTNSRQQQLQGQQ